MAGREHFYPRELSGGQQQRVGIARSLATKPEIWFLDEPFSALDPLIRREMQDELMRLQDVLHKTIVFITHDFDEAIRLADRIAIMKDGEIIQIGTPEELVVNPATDYVAEFTRDVQRAKVISARSLMRPCQTDGHAGTVAPDARIASFSARHRSPPASPSPSSMRTGKPIGEVTPQAVIDLLAGIDRSGGAWRDDRGRHAFRPGRPVQTGWWSGPLRSLAVACLCLCPRPACPGPSTIPPTPSCPSPTGSARS